LLLSLLALPVAHAQDVEVEEVQDLVLAAPAFEIPIDNFDQWVFGGGRNAQQGRQRLKSQVALQVEALDSICGLSDKQKAKLRLAASGDMKRFYDDVDVVRQQFLKVRRDQNAFNQIWQDIQPLQTRVNSGLFGEDSLLHKIAKRTLDAQQRAKYEEADLERRKFRYEAKVAVVLAMLESGVPLRDEQRQRFLKVLVEETQPPKKFGQYDYYVVMHQAAKVPEGKLKPIFDDAQWRALRQQFRQARGMEAFLQKNGFLP
jgi:hypothetical protein